MKQILDIDRLFFCESPNIDALIFRACIVVVIATCKVKKEF
jgi:hypothetical protein